MKSRIRSALSVLVATAVMSLSACAQAPAATVTVQLSWLHSIEFAGFYEAAASNYAQENLSVNLEPGLDSAGIFHDPIEAVTSGKADFGVIDAGSLLTARAAGKKIVAVATIYQRHPLAFTSLAEKNITRPQDLIGKKVLLNFAISGVAYRAMLASAGVDPSKVEAVDRTDDFTDKPLLDGRADVIDGWVTNEVVTLQQEGHQVNTILVSDYGVEMYPDVIFTTEEMIAAKPDLVLRFLRATVKGTQNAVDNPAEAVKLTLAYDPTLSADDQNVAMQQSLPLLKPAGSRPGAMTDEAWANALQILIDQKILAQPLDVKQAYSLKFLNEIYQSQ